MAGFVHVSDGVGCSMGSHDFRYFILEVRNSFNADEQDIVSDLYEYYDETRDCLLVLNGVDSRFFNAFCVAVEKTLKNNPGISERVGSMLVNELLDILKNDPRCKKAGRAES